MEVVASLSQGRTAAVQCGLFTHKSGPVIFEPPCICIFMCIASDRDFPQIPPVRNGMHRYSTAGLMDKMCTEAFA